MDSENRIVVGGIYTHFKTGKNYKVLCLARHSETLEDLVVYEALYENEKSQFWARPLSMFLEEVEFEGIKQPRFKLSANKDVDK